MSFAAFFERARTEAERYGPDPWVFVRELLQNARDAGATRVELAAEVADGVTRIRCLDDGQGMSFEHASDYLFTLYRSSKESDTSSVGKFGVGFWSILRFRPERITIRSHQSGHEPWEVTLEEGSPRAAQRRPQMDRGTELILERSGEDGEVLRRLRDAAVQNGRYLTQRDHPGQALTVTVQGQIINESFVLPAPNASFSWRGVRGVVALGDTPRVELFSRGLRVRAASCLEDLLSSDRASDKARVQFPSIEGVLAPQAILESDALELLLARSDAREDAALTKLVRRAQKELRKLVRRQLAALRPPTIRERLAELFRGLNEAPVWAQVGGAMVGGALVALLVAPLVWQVARPLAPDGARASTSAGPGSVRYVPAGPAPYHDLASEYFGPQVSPLDPSQAASIRLNYSPAELDLHLGALAVARLDGAGPLPAPIVDGVDAAYPELSCALRDDCVSLRLETAQPAGPMRVPVPVGHGLVAKSVRFVGAEPGSVRYTLRRTAANEAVLDFATPFAGTLAYQSTPAGDAFARAPSTQGGPLHPQLRDMAQELAAIADESARVERGLELVRERIAYSVDAEVAEQHAEAIAKGEGLVDRALRIGAGDCDVQNGILVLLLAETGLEARLVVGLVGRRGRANPWLHAWAEWRDRDGDMHFADASEGAPAPPLATQEFPELPEPSGQVLLEGDDPPPVAAGASSGSTATTADPSAASAPPPSGTLQALIAGYDRRGLWLAAGSLLVLLLSLFSATIWLIVTGRQPALAGQTNLGELLQGALRQPLAFRHLPELFTRRLVPTLHGPALSLGEARTLARAGQLYSGGREHGLPQRAAKRGNRVIDLDREEGRAVAGTLGAVDLEELARFRSQGRRYALLDELEALLAKAGYPWELRVVDELGSPLRSIDLESLGVARRGDVRRAVLIDREDAGWQHWAPRHATEPALARFGLLEDLLARLELSPQARGEIIAGPAAEALLEHTRGGVG